MSDLHDYVSDAIKFTGIIDVNGVEHRYKNGKRIDNRQDPTALIGFLAAKLACHNPDDSAVQWALEYLQEKK